MRVTSTMKDYIKRKVTEVYDKKIMEVEKDYIAEHDRIREKIDSMGREFENKVLDFLSHTEFEVDSIRGMNFYRTQFVIKCQEQEERIREEVCRLRDEKRDKIEEIIVTLELGGNKRDLDRMLSDLEWDVMVEK